jgi:hypothetical protein
VSIQAEFASGTFLHAKADALITISLTDILTFSLAIDSFNSLRILNKKNNFCFKKKKKIIT